MRYFFITLLFVLMLVPAATTFGAEGLVTCDGTDIDGGIACNFCKFASMIDRVVDFLVVILIIIATVMLAVTGLQMAYTAAGGSDARQILKDRMTNIVLGFILILASWTLIDVLIKVLVVDEEIKNWRTFIFSETSELCADPRTPTNEVVELHFDPYVPDPASEVSYTPGGGDCGLATESQVVPVPGEESHQLLPGRAAEYVAMREAAAAAGHTIRINEAWRSDNTQLSYWNKRGCDKDPSICSGRVAQPCQAGGNGSNHGRGLAVDIKGSSCGSGIYNWLKSNGSTWNFNNNLSCSADPWHWSPSGR